MKIRNVSIVLFVFFFVASWLELPSASAQLFGRRCMPCCEANSQPICDPCCDQTCVQEIWTVPQYPDINAVSSSLSLQACKSVQTLSNFDFLAGSCEAYYDIADGYWHISSDCNAGCFCDLPPLGGDMPLPGDTDPQPFSCVAKPNATKEVFYLIMSDTVAQKLTAFRLDRTKSELFNSFKIKVKNTSAITPYDIWEIVATWDEASLAPEPDTDAIDPADSAVAVVRRQTKFGDVLATIPFARPTSGNNTVESYNFGNWRLTITYRID